MITYIENEHEKEKIASEILNRLPDWFGLPDSTKRYIEDSKSMPFWAWMEEGQSLGFIALKETSPHTAEIYVMGVLPECHHKGIGRKLVEVFEAYARQQGYSFLQVKTVQTGHYEEYDRTNAFYQKMGFKELECLPLWDEWNPCQVYVKGVEQYDNERI